jgi:dTDP-4-dehydrorhamnose 3,5-epimerase
MAPTEITEFSHESTAIEGLFLVQVKQVDEDRGTVREIFRDSVLRSVGRVGRAWPGEVRQVNLTSSRYGVIRGLHGEAMTKLVGVAAGHAFGAYLDARATSSSYGTLVTLDLAPGRQVLVPSGVCNGFQAVSTEGCLYLYCFDSEWSPDMVGVAVNPLDPALGIEWPVTIDPDDRSLLSAKDAQAPNFADLPG